MADIIDRHAEYVQRYGDKHPRIMFEDVTLRLTGEEAILLRNGYPVTLTQPLVNYQKENN